VGEQTAIEWTDHTFNPWWGCQKISPACANCYAEGVGARFGGDDRLWGKGHAIRTFGDKHWNDPIRWDRKAAEAGVKARVFCGSMCDVFEALDDLDEHRARLWRLIEATPSLIWLLLTKRPEEVMARVPAHWSHRAGSGRGVCSCGINVLHGGVHEVGCRNGWPDNVWVGTTVEDQQRADERIPRLLRIPAPVRFLSCEPLLGPVDLTNVRRRLFRSGELDSVWDAMTGRFGFWSDDWHTHEFGAVSWVIAGGESGPKARPSHPDWFRALRDQCQDAGVPYFFKQWGQHVPTYRGSTDELIGMRKVAGKKAAGCLLDGVEHKAFPSR